MTEDQRSAEEIRISGEITKLDTAIDRILSSGVSQYSIAGRSATNLNLQDLRTHRRYLERQLIRHERKRRLGDADYIDPYTIRTAFLD